MRTRDVAPEPRGTGRTSTVAIAPVASVLFSLRDEATFRAVHSTLGVCCRDSHGGDDF
jgi:hypothetical protein